MLMPAAPLLKPGSASAWIPSLTGAAVQCPPARTALYLHREHTPPKLRPHTKTGGDSSYCTSGRQIRGGQGPSIDLGKPKRAGGSQQTGRSGDRRGAIWIASLHRGSERQGDAVCGEVVCPWVGEVLLEVDQGALACGLVLCNKAEESKHGQTAVGDLLQQPQRCSYHEQCSVATICFACVAYVQQLQCTWFLDTC